MPQQVYEEPQVRAAISLDPTLTRRASRQAGLFERSLLRAAFKQSFLMLRPDIQWKNPVMFVVEVGTVLSIIFTVLAVMRVANAERLRYFLALDVWLFLTVLFANFADGPGRGPGQGPGRLAAQDAAGNAGLSPA